MATQRTKEFLKTVSGDIVFRQKLENAASPEARRQLINEAGFSDVTSEDLQAAVKEGTAASELSSAEVDAVGELSDAELEAVAGGATTAWVSAVVIMAAAAL